MRITLLFFVIGLLVVTTAQSQNYIHTSGKYIIGPCNDTLELRGLNYEPYNWGYTLSDIKMDQVAQTGANAVRIPWYQNNPGATIYSNYVALDSAISKCIQYDMIAIIELHDFTCGNNSPNLIAGAGWWTSNNVLPILQKYKHSIIVNIANEALQVSWTGDPTTALATYKSTYETIITNLRNASGFDFPLMIDAPDCGGYSDAFITSNTAAGLVTFDPKHNLIFSAHAYWYAYANNDSLQMAGKINAIQTLDIPFILGEVANEQDDASMCQYTLNYKPLLNYCKTKKVNWLAWSWDHDGCPNRQLSSTGNFADLTPYGNDIVNNPNYGLHTHPAAKSRYLTQASCSIAIGIPSAAHSSFHVALFPNPANSSFEVVSEQAVQSVKAYDLMGNEVKLELLNDGRYRLNQPQGAYLITIMSGGVSKTLKLILN
jgi:mannan endo-1,4-beta-mannosidase